MKIKIQIKNGWTGDILFEYKKENNTIKDTLVEGVRKGVSFHGADLRRAALRRANLRDADLRDADLRGADLSCVDLRDADLRRADICDSDLSGANLRCAHLRGANFCGAYLCGAKDVPYVPFACPSEGAFIGWKKVNNKLVKLEIPEDAKRCSATTQKCRCDKAKVLEITDLDGKNPIDEILNTSQEVLLLYKVGEFVYPDSFDENRWNECSQGIHFFINKQDAILYGKDSFFN